MLTALVAALAFVLVAALPALGWRATALAAVLATGGAYVAIRVTADTFGGRTGDTLGACQQVTLVAFLVAAVEAIFRLLEFVHAPFYALFVVGPIANLIEIALTKRRIANRESRIAIRD